MFQQHMRGPNRRTRVRPAKTMRRSYTVMRGRKMRRRNDRRRVRPAKTMRRSYTVMRGRKMRRGNARRRVRTTKAMRRRLTDMHLWRMQPHDAMPDKRGLQGIQYPMQQLAVYIRSRSPLHKK